jgi:hypothetical protein
MKTKVNTIDVMAKEWLDKVNGNSYFSARVTVNFGTEKEKTFMLPFQYGYNDSYMDAAKNRLAKEGYINDPEHTHLWMWCRDNNVILRTYKTENCKKGDVIAWGQE